MNVCKTKDYSKAEEFIDQFMLEAYATSQVSFIYYINYLLTSSVRHLVFRIVSFADREQKRLRS